MEEDKEADKVADMVAGKKNADMELDMVTDKEIVKVADIMAGHGCWLIGSKLFRPESLIISLAKGGGKRPSTNFCRVCTHIL